LIGEIDVENTVRTEKSRRIHDRVAGGKSSAGIGDGLDCGRCKCRLCKRAGLG